MKRDCSIRRFLVGALLCALAHLAAACNVDPYCITCAEDDGGPGDDANNGDGGGDGDGDGDGGSDVDAGPTPDACFPAQEVCDEKDNDCDGVADNGIDTQVDPENCGGCGNVCQRTGANGTCEAGACVYTCKPNSYDLNGDINNTTSNGCEYFCVPPNPAEADGLDDVCDEADDDCDNLIDEDVDLMGDEANCGSCGNPCVGLNATPFCDLGTCDTTCVPTPGTGCLCDDGFRDVSAVIAGCEYQCPDAEPTIAGHQLPRPAGDEDCDGVDNDCDGAVDELPINGLGQDCTDPGFELVGDTGACEFGVRGCSFGVPTCLGYVRPQAELCEPGSAVTDDIDCDGVDDNGYDKLNDTRYCENCAGCTLANAIPECIAGTCEIQNCLPGFVDGDGNSDNGCEYACTPSGPEVCDGIDNDCDCNIIADPTCASAIDEPGAPPGGIGPPPAGLCKTAGACAGTVAQCAATPCDAVVTWRCVYDAPAELQGNAACGILVADEARCDGYLPGQTPSAADDGDCDGLVDESFPVGPQATSCDDGNQGICQGTGEQACDPLDASQTMCEITQAGQTALDGEICNNLDDDCDGFVDNDDPDDPVWDQMVQVDTALWVDTYEASRPDASDTLQGSTSHQACSMPGVQPWRNVDWVTASQACADAGKRLCTEAEWRDSCDGTLGAGGNKYPYGPTYIDDFCNGKDYDPDCTGPIDEFLVTTGFDYVCPVPQADTCVSDFGAYDMSGNLQEWTSTQVSFPPDPVTFRVKGGNYNTIAQGLTCSHAFVSFTETTLFPNLGFRCCSDTAPPAMPQPIP